MNYFLQGFGVFLGVIAGTAVTILTQRFLLWRQEKQKVQNLKFEIQFNMKQIDRWMEYLNGYRNAVNGDAIALWAEYFDFSHVIKSTIENMIQTGLIYKKMSSDSVSHLLFFLSSFNQSSEVVYNNKYYFKNNPSISQELYLKFLRLRKNLKRARRILRPFYNCCHDFFFFLFCYIYFSTSKAECTSSCKLSPWK